MQLDSTHIQMVDLLRKNGRLSIAALAKHLDISRSNAYQRYEALVEAGVITGFTANEILTALAVTITRLQEGHPFFENCYPRVVTREGSKAAQALIEKLMEPCDSEWRGLGIIPESGLRLRDSYADFDARRKFQLPKIEGHSNPACRCGEVLRGIIQPPACPLFGKACVPEHAVGPCMVSVEGVCAAWHKYGSGRFTYGK